MTATPQFWRLVALMMIPLIDLNRIVCTHPRADKYAPLIALYIQLVCLRFVFGRLIICGVFLLIMVDFVICSNIRRFRKRAHSQERYLQWAIHCFWASCVTILHVNKIKPKICQLFGSKIRVLHANIRSTQNQLNSLKIHLPNGNSNNSHACLFVHLWTMKIVWM